MNRNVQNVTHHFCAFYSLGVFLVCFGFCTQALSLNFVIYYSIQSLPKIIIATVLLVILGYVYFSPSALAIIDKVRNIENLTDGIFTVLEMIDGHSLKRIILGIAIFVPVFVEMLAISFLSRLVGENHGGWIKAGLYWIAIAVQMIILLPLHFVLEYSSNAGNESGILKKWGNGRYSFWRLTLIKKSSTTLFDCRLHAWIFLYAIALLTTIIQVELDNIHRPLLLAGPITLATGAFLIISRSGGGEQDLMADITRRVLRRTLGDILMRVGEDVAEDEMLRLAMIRWIVDYWATNDSEEDIMTKSKNGSINIGNDKTALPVTVGQDRARDGLAGSLSIHASSNDFESSGAVHTSPSTSIPESHAEGIGWSQLLSMLSLSTEHMYQEISDSTSGLGNQPRAGQRHNNSSIQDLQALLSSFNQNERAKPAVDSYKRAIADIYPSRNLAICAGLASRCPACLSMVTICSFFPMNAHLCTLVLLPLILFEVMRVSEWIVDCRRAENWFRLRIQDSSLLENNVDGNSCISSLFPQQMTSMEIILSQDNYSPFTPGKLLQVWLNVESSVKALESGLTAMKCVHTAQVATNVAFNVMSLTMFGMELKDKGLCVGLRLIVSDIFHFHYQKCQRSADESNYQHGQRDNFCDANIRGGHTAAMLDIVEKSQVLTRNVSELVEESKDEGTFLSPLVTFFNNPFQSNETPSDIESTEPNKMESRSHAANETACSKIEENKNDGIREVEVQPSIPVEGRVQLSSMPKCMIQKPILPQDLEFDNEESDDNSSDNVKSDIQEDSGFDSDDGSWTAIGGEISAKHVQGTPIPLVVDASSLVGHEMNNGDDERSDVKSQTIAVRHEVVESDQNNYLKWVGAGVAIFSTIIGGIALTSNNKDSIDHSVDGDLSRNRKSTVIIERLEDDAE